MDTGARAKMKEHSAELQEQSEHITHEYAGIKINQGAFVGFGFSKVGVEGCQRDRLHSVVKMVKICIIATL